MESFVSELAGLLFFLLPVLPLGCGLLSALWHLCKGRAAAYARNLNASIAGGIVALFMLSSSLFGDALYSSSTAGLVFVFAPIYSAIAQAIFWAVSFLATKNSQTPAPIPAYKKRLIWLPIFILIVLVVGLVKVALHNLG